MATVKCKAQFKTDSGEQVTAGEIAAFVATLPPEAVVSPMQVDKGNQRDPWLVLVGLAATWDEAR